MQFDTNAQVNSYYTYDRLIGIADYIKGKFNKTFEPPECAIICGSGLGEISNIVKNVSLTFKFKDLPGFPAATVSGHRGEIIFGEIGDKRILCMIGRFHPYEGNCSALCAIPIKLFKILGAKYLILTAAAGALNPAYREGDVVVIHDHISLPTFGGNNPLVGPNDERLGPRFPASNKIYSVALRERYKDILKELGLEDVFHEGIYVNAGGPSYESPAEVRALRILGGDMVGMSLTHESIAAGYMGLPVLAIALATNKCISAYNVEEVPSHSEVLKVADDRGKDICLSVEKFVKTFVCDQ